ncbi:tape measure protein [Pseudoalteromonas sp. L23]|uniref:tape measure protein n=1 Tax=unclassified Pseudoalteromonas TaxID=194690 RepID=UPI001EF0079A|nr:MULTISPECIES: tape measure protein [unclassified Pseudoalteromonas]MCF7512955.1 tape measure protein [Pseudoalteromonas sp. L7]MCF7524995.1 tape measure protein [Pseudoalteromonas sp. L23]
MKNQLNLALRLKYDGRAVTSGTARNLRDLNQLPQALNRQVAANQRLGASQGQLMRQQSAMGSQLGLLSSGYDQLAGSIASIVSLGTAAMFVRDTGNAQLLDTRLQGLTDSAQEYNAVQNYLFATADRLNTKYTTLADSYSRILNLQEAGVVTQSQGIKILEGFANAAAKTGASNVQLEQSLFGMTQGMTAGVLRAEELNQVTEPLPGLMQKLDKAAGQVAGGFRQMVNDGKVTSQMFKQYLIKAFDEYAGAAEATEGKINASFAEMSNEYQRLIRHYEQPVNFAVTTVVSSITEAMQALRENEEIVDGLTTSATLLAVVIGSRLAGSAYRSAAAFTTNAVSTHKALQAQVQLAAQTKRNAAIELQHSIQQQQAAQRQLAMARNTMMRTNAIHNLALANQRAAAAQAVHTAATTAYTAAATRASFATRALTGAMGLLGGPVGLAVTAGLAIAYFANQSDEASTSSKKLKVHLYELGDAFDSVGNASSVAQIKRAQKEAANYTKNIEEAYTKLATLKKRQAQSGSDRSKFVYAQQITEVERYITAQSKLRAEKLKLANEAANLNSNLNSIDWKMLEENATSTSSALPENIQRLQLSLLDEEARLKASHEKRRQMVIAARESDATNKAKYDAILKQLDAKYAEDVKALAQKRENDKTRIQNQSEEKRRNDLRAALENRIAQIKGHANREALAAYENELAVEQARQQARIDAARRQSIGLAANDESGEIKYNADNQIRDIERQQELLAAEGFHSEVEKREWDHQERLMQLKTKNTGALQQHLMEFANWEKKNTVERTSAVLGLGMAGLKAMGQQSKKAFKMYKAFAISQALIKTYESATGAYSALAWIKPIGPALGAAAAAAAIAMGMAQVRQIKAQQPSGIAHGGLDYVPNESTYVLQRGERVLSPKQNIEVSAMARHYNAGNRAQSGGGNISFNITNHVVVQGATDEASAQRTGNDVANQIRGLILQDIQENGVIIQSIRRVA